MAERMLMIFEGTSEQLDCTLTEVIKASEARLVSFKIIHEKDDNGNAHLKAIF